MAHLGTGNSAALAVALTALWLAPPVWAQIYQWTDGQGRIHFTQSLDKVPPDQRAAAEARAGKAPERRLNRSSAPAAPAPGAGRRSPRGELQIPFIRDGSLMRVEGTINGRVRVPFLIDTGASGVSLPSAYADRLGLVVGRDTQYVRVQTANGIVARPLVRLDSVEIGGARVENLMATINPAMPVGLLGGDFFNNFVYSVDAAAGVISLAPNANIRGGLSAEEWQERFLSIREPLERLEDHIRDHPKLRDGELAELELHRERLQARLAALEREADQLDVPQIWRD